jgi:hypothetical protein
VVKVAYLWLGPVSHPKMPGNTMPAAGKKTQNQVTFYNDCDSLFTQAEKDFTETATNNK